MITDYYNEIPVVMSKLKEKKFVVWHSIMATSRELPASDGSTLEQAIANYTDTFNYVGPVIVDTTPPWKVHAKDYRKVGDLT